MSPPIGPATIAGVEIPATATLAQVRRYGAEFPQGDRGEFSNGRYGLALR